MAQINPALPLAGKEYNAALGVGRDAFQDNRASIEAAATTTAVAAAAYVGGDGGNGNAANNAAAAPTTPRKRGPSILKFASLSDIERNQLHLEIYNYFTWLNTELTEMETSHGGRRSVSNAGIVVSNLRGVIGKMEGAFRVIKKKDDKATAKAAAASAGGGTGTPFLEEILGPSLKQLVKQVPPHSKRGKYKKGGKEDSTRMQGKELDFDSMYAKLLEFQKGKFVDYSESND